MASSRRRRDQRQRQRHRAAEAARRDGIIKAVVERLPGELHAEIHRRIDFLKRLAFASVCGKTGHMLRPEAPWLILPGQTLGNNALTKQKKAAMAATVLSKDKAVVLSMADVDPKNEATASVRIPDLAMLERIIIGSSDGWLVTVDERGVLRIANPATGAQAALPAIDTIPFLNSSSRGKWFILDVEPFLQVRFGGPPPPEDKDWGPYPPRSSTLTAEQMRQRFYRKVVLSSSPRPGSYTAMLITDKHIGAPAFATAADPVWRMARSPGGVEDAIYHDGLFYSVSYDGDVEVWQRDAVTGEFGSQLVARLVYDDKHLCRKYLAASPDGQLMAVLKHSEQIEKEPGYRRSTITHVSFKVQVLDQMAERWESVTDIGDAALFVGVNGSLFVSTREHPCIKAGCVYFTDDEVGDACLRHAQGAQERKRYDEADETELRETCVYDLKYGRVIEKVTENGPLWPPPAWFTPSCF
jgi:hypothetical protein